MINDCTHECIIIGAGLYGLAAARTYLEIHPTNKLVILESQSCLGGVWSVERNYDAFWTQTPWNMACFSGKPMGTPLKDEDYHGFFPARRVTEYLEGFSDDCVYDGTSLRERISFNERVTRINFEAHTKSWIIETNSQWRLRTGKLMVCSGLTSVPNMPTLPGQKDFKGLIVHHRDFGSSEFLEDLGVRHVAVLGGAKSAADVAYAAAKAGKQVSWIVRKSGAGPGALVPAKGVGPYKNSNEVLYTRLSGLLTPSIWTDGGLFFRILHKTWLGRKLADMIWANFDVDARKAAGFSEDAGSSPRRVVSVQNLEPDTTLFWANDSNGVSQREDFWDVIRAENVMVHREDILRLEGKAIIMPGCMTKADVIVCCTGWTPSFHSFFDEKLQEELGLPVAIDSESRDLSTSEETAEDWARTDRVSELEVLKRFPRLQNPPQHFKAPLVQSPFRLWRHMVPANGSSKHPGIVFSGSLVVGNNFRCADVQSLWAVAYLDNKIPLPSTEQMQTEVSMQVTWCRRRYLEKGKLGHWLWYDLVGYTDCLLHDLGVDGKKKKIWEPYLASDLDGAVAKLTRQYYTVEKERGK